MKKAAQVNWKPSLRRIKDLLRNASGWKLAEEEVGSRMKELRCSNGEQMKSNSR